MSTKTKHTGHMVTPRWKKGESGNPKGRQKLPDIREAMRELMADEINGKTTLQLILQQLRSMAAKGDIRAIQELLDRGYGKAKQSLDVNDVTRKPMQIVVSTKETAQDLEKIFADNEGI